MSLVNFWVLRSKAQNVGFWTGYLDDIPNFRWHLWTFGTTFGLKVHRNDFHNDGPQNGGLNEIVTFWNFRNIVDRFILTSDMVMFWNSHNSVNIWARTSIDMAKIIPEKVEILIHDDVTRWRRDGENLWTWMLLPSTEISSCVIL